jgi:hypothetical protein
MNITAQEVPVQMAVNGPIAARRRKEVLMENCAHSIAQNYVTMTKCSVKEELMRLDVRNRALVKIKLYTNGEIFLALMCAKDTVQANVKLMKSCVLHS